MKTKIASTSNCTIKLFRYYVFILIILWPLNTVAVSDKFSAMFIDEISNKGAVILCNDSWFLSRSGINKNACGELLREYSKECNKLILPLVPSEITGEDEDIYKIKKLGNLSELYSMCLIAITFQNEIGP